MRLCCGPEREPHQGREVATGRTRRAPHRTSEVMETWSFEELSMAACWLYLYMLSEKYKK